MTIVASAFWLLVAQDAPAANPMASYIQPMAFAAIGLLFFFMIFRPQQQERKRREEQLKAIKKNDRVLTSSGIFGVVTNVQAEQNEVTLRVDEKNDTKLRVQLSSIARIIGEGEGNDTKTEVKT